MKINAATSIGVFQDVEIFSIAQGQDFVLEAETDNTQVLRWFSDNDPVLTYSHSVGGASISAKATYQGDCELQIQIDGIVSKRIFVSVIPPQGEATNVKVKTKVEPLGS